ncbi:MAG: lnt, partial [Phycisphaerales bacterium]|nr:lnt [Phycisphaerales bacterium]
AAWWSWVAAAVFFGANLFWLVPVTGPGVAALVVVVGLYWAVAGALLRPWVRRAAGVDRTGDVRPSIDAATSAPTRHPQFAIRHRPALALLVVLPTLWVALEWLRNTWPWGGFGWFALGHAQPQTPALILCQIADVTGENGVSFWVGMLNAVAALFVFNGWRFRGLGRPVAVAAGVMAVVLAYGAWRYGTTEANLLPGPTVLVVQPNFRQDNTNSEKGATADEILDFHASRTDAAQRARQAKGEPPADLVVWSETMMPSLNPEARAANAKIRRDFGLSEDAFGYANDQASAAVSALARRYRSAMLVGGSYARDVVIQDFVVDGKTRRFPAEVGRRNSAYYFTRDAGALAGRFDKIHLVPFGEFIPFREGWPWLYRQFLNLGPPNMEGYVLERGDRPVVFDLPRSARMAGTPATEPAAADVGTPGGDGGGSPAGRPWRFVTPICFEDTDADLNARFVRGGAARGSLPPGGKAADLIVNVTNGGWFLFPQQLQELQIATFRAIENRVPIARAVNTGTSGFVDSLGRTSRDLILPTGTPRPGTKEPATLVHQVRVDARTTVFTRWGNLLGPACGVVAGGMAVAGVVGAWRRRRNRVPIASGRSASSR